jgi:anti-sigma regulatory factor (Ser/Thr protein kinase)
MEFIAENGLVSIVKIDERTFELRKSTGFEKSRGDDLDYDSRYDSISEVGCLLFGDLEKTFGLRDYDNDGHDLAYLLLHPLENAEAHGNKYDSNKITRISYRFDDNGDSVTLFFEIEDEGDGFNYQHVVEAESGTSKGYNDFREESPEGSVGNGLLRLADRVEWNEEGNVIRVTKYLKLKE